MWRIVLTILMPVWLYGDYWLAESFLSKEQCPNQQPEPLQLLVMLPFPNPIPEFNPSWTDAPKILPALYLAADQINNRSDILPCHQLELAFVDGGCDIAATTAYSAATGLIGDDGGMARVVGMIGPGCSASTLQTAHALNQPDIELVHIHDAGSPLLSDRNMYPNSLGILGSTQSFVDLSLALMWKSGWRNIAILFESNRVYFRSTKEAFVASLNSNVSLLFSSPVYTTFYPLNRIRSTLARIVFVFTSTSHSMKIMCLAYHMGMVYPAYQWIIISHRLTDFIGVNASLSDNITFSYSGQIYSCSLGTLLNTALERTFLLSYQLKSLSSSNNHKLANTTFEEFLQLYEERAASENVTATYWAYNLYDAIWAWASVLHRITVNNSDLLNNYEYGNKTVANAILNEFYAHDFEFEGMSGLISFNSSNGFYDRPSNLYQVVGGEERHIAYNNGTTIIKLQPLEIIPDLVRVTGLVNVGVITIFAIVQLLEFIALVVLHVFTVVYRNEPTIRASSPKLSHFAFVGTYILILGLMLFVFIEIRVHPAEVSGPVCQTIWGWLFPIGFTLTIGTLTVRTWRLYRIFIHYLNPGKFISNTALITMLVILLSIDIVIAIIWTALDPLRLVIVGYPMQIGPASGLVLDRSCRSQSGLEGFIWWVIVMSIRITELLVMVVLSLLTRRIPNKNFTTSSLRVFAYVFSGVFALGLILYYMFVFLSLNPNIDFSILCLMMNILILLYIACVFSPPLVPVLRAKIQKACDSKSTSQATHRT